MKNLSIPITIQSNTSWSKSKQKKMIMKRLEIRFCKIRLCHKIINATKFYMILNPKIKQGLADTWN
jgi:hypothetical protein